MRPVTSFFVVLAILTSCRSQKAVQVDTSMQLDSVAHSEHHRSFAQIDSAVSRYNLDFDTLNIIIERPVADIPAIDGVAVLPNEVIKIKAVKGKFSHSKEQQKFATANEQRLDTLAYKLSAVDKSAEHTATTRVYDPPNATSIILLCLLMVGGVAYFYFHRKQ